MRLILWRIGFFWPDSIDSFFYFFSDYLLLLIVSFAACAFWVNGYWKKSVWITVIKPSAVYCITYTVMPRPKCAIHTTKVRGFVWLIACVCVLLYNTDIPFRWIDWWFSSIFIWLFTENNLTIVQGIKGLASGVFFDNLAPSFLEVR